MFSEFLCPYVSYQRGTNKNINGLIWRFWKKGTDFSLTDNEINMIQNTINNISRKMFNFSSSNDIYLKKIINKKDYSYFYSP